MNELKFNILNMFFRNFQFVFIFNYRVIFEENMTPFIVDEKEEWEDCDGEAGDDEDHHHQAAVHHAAAQLHPGVEVHHWEIL